MATLTKQQASRLIVKNVQLTTEEPTCGHTGCTDHENLQTTIFDGYSGCRVLADVAVEAVEEAQQIRSNSYLGRRYVILSLSNGREMTFGIFTLPIDIACEFCANEIRAGECCSSHKKQLCHGCYRMTHFVEVCVDGCQDCSDESLQKIMKARNS